ncbi:hypothetical protein SYNTR_1969 [Candidatus Syntrophocurvum alkaliphilum]|uniref:Uncharacterized protein n=1 Tax=Candidatus Syntrophocurvum alkaliphilum TaxID=2293317 RepID=A0A6I6DHK1_9FIRM|nr:hypothetical protein [Candidatus Syntrophocurvum alkaliphilum]QGU00563.1 hypothetical protein SYNTR_1969 [Candidatus Syntrophocurvum alkaliphilum]
MISHVKIGRKQKNIMRGHLEKIIKLHYEVNNYIEEHAKQTEVEEYKDFFQNIKDKNIQTVQLISKYMVRKCNR